MLNPKREFVVVTRMICSVLDAMVELRCVCVLKLTTDEMLKQLAVKTSDSSWPGASRMIGLQNLGSFCSFCSCYESAR
jgi:hypothetical protein